jgi:2-dehydro-3-deoxyphosphooctonate aldolase (KDO 8-P synthase)
MLRELGCPVWFDVTHAVRSTRGEPRRHMDAVARAGVAAGVDGLFVETHPDPSRARSNARTQIPLDRLEAFLTPLLAIHEVVQSVPESLR